MHHRIPVVHARIFSLLILSVAAGAYLFAQNVGARAAGAPRITIELPDNVPSDTVWIRYVLTGPGSSGAVVRRQPNVRQYVIEAMIGGMPARHAKIVVYAPGCQFKAYALHLDGASDISKHFECDPLPSKTVHGFLAPAEIPSGIFPGEKKLSIVGELEPYWVCDFFLQQRRGGAVIVAGSCLSVGIPLGRVGDLDPANGGNFEITIPDFTRDPLFQGTDEVTRAGDFGVIELFLEDKMIGRGLGGMKPENAGSRSGLNVENEYPDPVLFTTKVR